MGYARWSQLMRRMLIKMWRCLQAGITCVRLISCPRRVRRLWIMSIRCRSWGNRSRSLRNYSKTKLIRPWPIGSKNPNQNKKVRIRAKLLTGSNPKLNLSPIKIHLVDSINTYRGSLAVYRLYHRKPLQANNPSQPRTASWSTEGCKRNTWNRTWSRNRWTLSMLRSWRNKNNWSPNMA